ncbi:transcription elongation factor GreB [Solimonas terrae]|uniref:Transcription elongation factor GreB n=1 Tax=Solimonas terrae TaxID=1396819 RepID=A0A6M2BMD8_9GAMM|nr:transcription elongation factor GreB [Solimonas terrae]NGY03756.1 transcription elongation factor GreB [Solimonas terrae]
MSRWRPPSEKSSPYITAEGQVRLKREFEQLWRARRPEVVRALAAAAAEGDRSENAEYQYRKKELREIDARLKYLTQRLEDVKIVERQASSDGKIYFGAWVELADEAGEPRRYRVVGADETDSTIGWISVDSPLARALLGRASGEIVKVQLPGGAAEFEIKEVRYTGFDSA